MATINPTSAGLTTMPGGDGSVRKFLFEGLGTTNTTTAPIPFAEWADRSVQMLGNFANSATVVVEGSNDGGTTWATLTDPQGNALSFTAAKIEAITEICEFVRCSLSSGGNGSTDIDIVFLLRRQNPMRT